MRAPAGAVAQVVAACVCAALLIACGAPGPKPADRSALRAISLPDLSRMTESVQEQVRAGSATLAAKKDDPATTDSDLAGAYGEMGKLLMAARYYDAAESCYLDAQALAPADVRWTYYLGHLYKAKGALDQSAAAFERALQLQPESLATLVWLSDVYLAQGRPEAAEPMLANARSLEPRSVAALFGSGRAALARKDFRQAVTHLEAALAANPKATAIHYPLGMAYRGLGEQAKANEHLQLRQAPAINDANVLPADPLMEELEGLLRSPTAYEVRGTRALDMGDWAGAAAHFRKGLELAPSSASLRHKLGTALFQMGDAPGAIEQFEEAVRVSPDYAKAHYSLGVLLASSGRDREAIERFATALTSEPSYVEARLNLAALLRRSGRVQEALAQYQQVLDIDPRVPEAMFGYAMGLVRLGRYDEASRVLAAGLNIHPNHPGLAHAAARLLAAAPDARVRDGRRALNVMQALSDQQRAMDLGETMAMAFAEVGQYDQAVEWQRQAVDAAKRAGREVLAQRMTENLRMYERRQPSRAPWRPGELP